MKPKLCLINPPHPYLKDPTAQAPLGLLYVAASAREQGFEVEFVDLSDKHFKDYFDLPEADIYGITGTVLDRTPIHIVAKQIKKNRRAVIVGGPIALSPEHLDRKLIDSIVVGEGERIILKILQDYPRLKPKYVADRIEDLDNLPFPARDLLGENLGGSVFANRKVYFEGGSTAFVTSRGCPFGCVFCASPKIWGRHIVYRSPENIVKEIEHVVETYGVRQFRFSDDNVTANRTRLMKLCELLKGKQIAWRASIRVRPNDYRMFDAMKEAGCTEVCFGIESADPEVLRTLCKGASVRDNRMAIVNAHRAGLAVRILFMTGTPGETKKTTELNMYFLDDLQEYYDTIALTNFVPLPGTGVAEQPLKYGCEILDDDIDKFNLCMWGPDGSENDWPHLVRPVGMTLDDLTKSKRMMRDFVISIGKSNEG